MGQKLLDSIPRKVPKGQTGRKWSEHIRRLHTTDGYTVEEVQSVLAWYCKVLSKEGDLQANGNPNYYPIAFSGSSFRQKFDRLQGRMAQDRLKHGGPSKQMKVESVVSDEEITDEEMGW